MAGSKKKSNTLLLLLIAMVLLIGAYAWLVQYNNKKEQLKAEATNEGTATIVTLEADTIETIYFKNDMGEMTLKKGTDGTWLYTKDESFPVKQTEAENMKNALAEIISSRTITEGTEELSAFGLDTPSIQITATTTDGTATSLSLGAKVPIAGEYYARLNGGNEVYIVSSAFYNSFHYSVTQMTEVETIPSIGAETITHLAVESKDKQAFEVVYDSLKSSDLSGFTNWTMIKPYDTPIPADGDALTTLFGNYTALSFLACVDYKGEDLSKYGLTNPYASVTLNYYEETPVQTEETTKTYYSYELLIGNQDSEGNYYAKSNSSNAVYTISASTVETLLEIDSYSNAYHYINLINLEAIKKVTINIGGKEYTLSIEKKKETKDGTDTEVSKYYYNGQEADETSFKELYQALVAPVTDREIPKDYTDKNSNKASVMTVTYELTSKEEPFVIQYKPYDESYYSVNSDGVEYFLTDARTINELVAKIKEYKPQAE